MRRLLSRANRFFAPCAAINQLHGAPVKLGPLRGRELVRFGSDAASSLAAPCLFGIFIVPSARRLHTQIQGRTNCLRVKSGVVSPATALARTAVLNWSCQTMKGWMPAGMSTGFGDCFPLLGDVGGNEWSAVHC